MTFSFLGAGQTTHVLVDTLQHPAVEKTQAEGAPSISDTSSASSASSSSSLDSLVFDDEWVTIVMGVVGGAFGCVLLLTIVSVTIGKYLKRNGGIRRGHNHSRSTGDSNNSGNNSESSSSEKICFADQTVTTSDHMVLMSNGEFSAAVGTGEGGSIIGTNDYHGIPNTNHDHKQLQQPYSHNERLRAVHLHNQQPASSCPKNHDSGGFSQNVSSMRKGILKHYSGMPTSAANTVNAGACNQQSKTGIVPSLTTTTKNGEKHPSNVHPLPQKQQTNTTSGIAPSSCGEDHLNAFGEHMLFEYSLCLSNILECIILNT